MPTRNETRPGRIAGHRDQARYQVDYGDRGGQAGQHDDPQDGSADFPGAIAMFLGNLAELHHSPGHHRDQDQQRGDVVCQEVGLHLSSSGEAPSGVRRRRALEESDKGGAVGLEIEVRVFGVLTQNVV